MRKLPRSSKVSKPCSIPGPGARDPAELHDARVAGRGLQALGGCQMERRVGRNWECTRRPCRSFQERNQYQGEEKLNLAGREKREQSEAGEEGQALCPPGQHGEGQADPAAQAATLDD
jgi:hypothetical protein